jgi:hypothetical protein
MAAPRPARQQRGELIELSFRFINHRFDLYRISLALIRAFVAARPRNAQHIMSAEVH